MKHNENVWKRKSPICQEITGNTTRFFLIESRFLQEHFILKNINGRMIDSLFILGDDRQIIIEKHWKGVINRSTLEPFYVALKNCVSSVVGIHICSYLIPRMFPLSSRVVIVCWLLWRKELFSSLQLSRVRHPLCLLWSSLQSWIPFWGLTLVLWTKQNSVATSRWFIR